MKCNFTLKEVSLATEMLAESRKKQGETGNHQVGKGGASNKCFVSVATELQLQTERAQREVLARVTGKSGVGGAAMSTV